MKKISMTGGLDDWLEKRGIRHPLILPVVRNQILLLLCAFFVATASASESLWGMWFSGGFAVMTIIYFDWARFFLRAPLGEFGKAAFTAIVFHFLLRLVLIGLCVYAALVYGEVEPSALLSGVAAGTFAPLLTVIRASFGKKQ